MSASNPYKPPPSVVAQVVQLPQLSFEEIKALWRELYQQEPPTHARVFLEKRLAFRLQERAFGCAQPQRAMTIEERVQALIDARKTPSDKKRYPKPIPGTVLTRYYQGRDYQVTMINDHQFEFEGRLYNSLSVIAREITGTRWSGPLFFGLRKTPRKKNTRRGKPS